MNIRKIVLQVTALIAAAGAQAQNPIIQTIYTADPAPMVYKDTVYLYTGHDEDKSTVFVMKDWHCFTSTDMVNWTHRGSPLSIKAFSWAKQDAWAGQCIPRNGKFYWYVPMTHETMGMSIGVAVSDSPTGPFKDALGKPLVHSGKGDIDPTVFVDDDGQAYLYWGNPYLMYVKLNEDMISYSGEVVTVPLNKEGFNVRYKDVDTRPSAYEEGPWFYKRKNLYYMVYPAGGVPEHLAYSTSTGATGPWVYGDTTMRIIDNVGAFTNHPGVIDYKGKSYLFYHNGALPGGGGFTRSVCVNEFRYNKDGSIPRITPTAEGVKPVEHVNPFIRQEAETIAWEQGIETERSTNAGVYVTKISHGDFIKVRSVDFKKGAGIFQANVSSASGGFIEIHVDSCNGELLGSCEVKNTGGLQNWTTVSTKVKMLKGVHDLYFVFKGNQGDLFNFNWWKFDGDAQTNSHKPKVVNEKPDKKFANVSPKLTSNNGNPLLDFMFTADPTAVEYNGRIYVYATNDHQQYEHVGKDGKNTYEHIRTLVMMSSDDMVNWTYHGLINTAELSPWSQNSWAPSITSRLEADGKTHFYLYYSNSGVGSAVLTSTSPVGPWSDPVGKNIVDRSVPGVDVDAPFDPGVVIDDQGTGWLTFGGGTPKTKYMPDNARIVKLGADMISLASDVAKIPAPYFFEASDLNFINGTWVYTYNTSWEKRTEWPYSNIDKPTQCSMCYMTSKTPLHPDSWKYRDNYFKNTGEYSVGPLTNNHTHLFPFKGKYYITYHAMYLQDYFGTKGGFRNVGIEEMQVDEEHVNIRMGKATFKGPSQLNPLNPFVLQQAETTAGTSGQVQFEGVGNAGNMVAKGKADKQCLMVRGADFSKQIPAKFEARVKGKGKIDVYVNNLTGTALVSLICDGKEWTTLSKKIERKIDKGVGNIYFVFNGADFLFDEWKFIY